MDNLFRPCIDLHQGRVKQIVGATLFSKHGVTENFSSNREPDFYATLFKNRKLFAGHVVMLGEGNEEACKKIIETWPGAFDVGGGLDFTSAQKWLDRGARKVIFTSYLFEDGRLSEDRLEKLGKLFSPKQVVFDLSCKKEGGKCGDDLSSGDDWNYRVMIKQWKEGSEQFLNEELIALVARYSFEILVHAIDAEGKSSGIDQQLVERMLNLSRMAAACKHPVEMVYAGGISSYDDVEKILRIGKREIAFTVGSALDIYGGRLKLDKITAML